MYLYKYRDLSDQESAFDHLSQILRTCRFWCAKPSDLNDPEEFVWDCTYAPSDQTVRLFAEALIKLGRPASMAWQVASKAVQDDRIEPAARPVIQALIDQCRQEIGLACFATSNVSDLMWNRYGGGGNGVCIEVEVPDEVFRRSLHRVEYPLSKRLHVDQMLAIFGGSASAELAYTVALLSKPHCWAPEKEVRFISKRQNVSVNFTGSRISGIVLGRHLAGDVEARVDALVKSLPYDLRLSKRVS